MDNANTYGKDSRQINFKIWTCEEADVNQNTIPKSLPPALEISRFLKCCRCSEMVSLILSSPKQNVICLNSHSICKSCLNEVTVCQYQYSDGNKCHQPFVTIPKGHMNIFDYLRHESQIYCPYWNVGCKEVVIGRSLEFHLEKECAFRPLSSCIYTGCPMKRIVMSDLVNHIEYDHSVNVELDKSFRAIIDFNLQECFKTGDKQTVLALLECYESHFIIVMHETYDKYFIWALQCPFLDTVTISNRRDFKTRVQIFDRFAFVSKTIKQLAEMWEPSGLRKIWDFPVHSVYHPIEEIIHLGQCFEFPKQALIDNANFYLGLRKDGSKFWRMEIEIYETNTKTGKETTDLMSDTIKAAKENEQNLI